VTLLVVPAEPAASHDPRRECARHAARRACERRATAAQFRIFVLHVAQIAIFVVVPVALVNHAGLALSEHWKVYLPVIIGSFASCAAAAPRERRGRLKFLFLASIACCLRSSSARGVLRQLPLLGGAAAVLLRRLQHLEACCVAGVAHRAGGLARDRPRVYNTTQALASPSGGGRGWLAQHFGDRAVFVFGFAAVALWLLVASSMRVPVDAAEGVS